MKKYRPAASLALSTIDYFKDSDGNSKLDLLLKAAGDAIDRSLDCNLGLGIRNAPQLLPLFYHPIPRAIIN